MNIRNEGDEKVATIEFDNLVIGDDYLGDEWIEIHIKTVGEFERGSVSDAYYKTGVDIWLSMSENLETLLKWKYQKFHGLDGLAAVIATWPDEVRGNISIEELKEGLK